VTGSLPELLTRAALEYHGRTAVVADRTLTYGELDELASRVAAALVEAGVRLGDRVAVCDPKSAGAVASQYGVMRAGAAYVPIDPAAPDARAIRIANDCAVTGLIADRERLDRLGPDLPPAAIGLDLDRLDTLPPADAARPAVAIDPGDLAYVLYTSGSTGTPKGVMLSHGNARSFVDWAVGELRLTVEDRFSSHAPFHFDLSVFDLYACASVGGTMHAVPDEVLRFGTSTAAFVRERELTVWYSVPSALVQWVTQGGVDPSMLASLRHVVFAGEVFPTPFLRRLRDLVPGAELHNWYGPTETNVCTAHTVRPEDLTSDEPVPIGRPCDGYPCRVVDEQGAPAVTGELLVGGPAVTAGYWGDPELSAAALLTDVAGGPWYRTGDLVETGPQGEYRFRGRRDHQVKVRGNRVELGEVEAALHADDRVGEACVVAVADERRGHDLVAFVVPSARTSLDPVEVKRIVASRLPRYMVPATVHVRPDPLPATSTGKVDRAALEILAGG
jgi:amino acid adenylation domain-containing protein